MEKTLSCFRIETNFGPTWLRGTLLTCGNLMQSHDNPCSTAMAPAQVVLEFINTSSTFDIPTLRGSKQSKQRSRKISSAKNINRSTSWWHSITRHQASTHLLKKMNWISMHPEPNILITLVECLPGISQVRSMKCCCSWLEAKPSFQRARGRRNR